MLSNPVEVSASAVATGVNILSDILLVEALDYVSFQVSGTFVGTVGIEVSLDNVTYYPLVLTPVGGGSAVSTLTAPGMTSGVLAAKYMRINVSAYTSGTIGVVAKFWN